VDNFQIEISIPCDDDGYVLLKCPICGAFFKATPSDIKDEHLLELFCPSCGLSNDNYLTEDVVELGMKMLNNAAMDAIHNQFKKLEKDTKNGFISFKAGPKPKHETIEPLRSTIEALEITNFLCCNRSAKIKPLLKMTGCYCPFCGVKNYELE
jgi:hypothetical protein